MLLSIPGIRWPVAALLAILCAATSCFQWKSTDPRPVGSIDEVRRLSERDDINLLFVLIDTLRADNLGSYGYTRDTSPSLDYLAETGVRFSRHLAQSSWTKTSMVSLWTGVYPVRTGVMRSEHAISPEARMPAEILQEAGFRTIGLWRNGWVAPNFGFDQGFDVYQKPLTSRAPRALRRSKPHLSIEGTDNDAVDAVSEFLRIQRDERWFLYVHLMDVHQYLYDEDSALFGTEYVDMYDNSVRHEDGIVGALLHLLADSGSLDKTIVVLASDHGEAFGERGIEGHAQSVYRESTEVPFIIAFPFLLEPGIVVEGRTRNIDVWPTLLDLLGLPPLPDADGRSLLPSILAGAEGQEEFSDDPESPLAIAHLDRSWGRPGNPSRPIVAVSRGPHRLLYAPTRDGGTMERLFDREESESEQRNVAEDQPEVVSELREHAIDYLNTSPISWGEEPPEIELDEMQLNQLRALGYAVDQ